MEIAETPAPGTPDQDEEGEGKDEPGEDEGESEGDPESDSPPPANNAPVIRYPVLRWNLRDAPDPLARLMDPLHRIEVARLLRARIGRQARGETDPVATLLQ